MKKIIYLITSLILLGIATLLIFNYYKKNVATIYTCKYDNADSQYYSLQNDGRRNKAESVSLKCKKKDNIKCQNCELIGNTIGYNYNNEQLVLLYSKKNKSVTIFNIEKSNVINTIENVKFNNDAMQRRQDEAALYNDGKLIGFIFPNNCKESLQCEKLYNLEKGKEFINEKSPEFWVQNESPLTNPSYYMNGYNKASVTGTGIPNYVFITNITNGIIPVRTEDGANLYNIVEGKYLNDFEVANIYAINSGFIYHYHPDIIKFYNQKGELMFSNDNNKFDIDDIEILQGLNKETLLVIGTKNSNNIEKAKIIDQEGNVKVELPISTSDVENDIKSILKTEENYNQLKFPSEMYNYLTNCYYAGENNSELVITFSHQNDKNKVDAEVTYSIDINTKKIIDKKTEKI